MQTGVVSLTINSNLRYFIQSLLKLTLYEKTYRMQLENIVADNMVAATHVNWPNLISPLHLLPGESQILVYRALHLPIKIL